MTNKLEVFTNDEFGSVRTLTIDGEPWFVGKDVASILGYKNGNRDICHHIDEDDRQMIDRKTQYQIGIELGQRGGWLINESGLYSLVLSSKLPSAKKFKRWITSEVIPSIRKHGVYMTDNLLDAVIDNPAVMGEVIEKLKADKGKVARLEGELKAALPKAVYYDRFVDPGYSICFRDTAKEMGIPQKCFINLLIDHGFIYRTTKNELRPMAKPLKDGLFILRDYTNMRNFHRGTYTLVTAKGKQYIAEYFAEKGIIVT